LALPAMLSLVSFTPSSVYTLTKLPDILSINFSISAYKLVGGLFSYSLKIALFIKIFILLPYLRQSKSLLSTPIHYSSLKTAHIKFKILTILGAAICMSIMLEGLIIF
jgi:hypothetical protein